MLQKFGIELRKLCDRYKLRLLDIETSVNIRSEVSGSFSVCGMAAATENPMMEFYNHVRPLSEVIRLMNQGDLAEVFLCGRMFRVIQIAVGNKMRFFELVGTHTAAAELIHLGDFDRGGEWVVQGLIRAMLNGPKSDASQAVIAELVTIRMKV
jgi:hypothetical protein